jgi:hypothetical protein
LAHQTGAIRWKTAFELSYRISFESLQKKRIFMFNNVIILDEQELIGRARAAALTKDDLALLNSRVATFLFILESARTSSGAILIRPKWGILLVYARRLGNTGAAIRYGNYIPNN